MKNRKKIAAIAVICIMVLVVFSLIGLAGRKNNNADGDSNESVSVSSRDSEEEQESSLHTEKSTDAKEEAKQESMTDESEEKAVLEDDRKEASDKTAQENLETGKDLYPVMPETQGSNVSEQATNKLTFPYDIPNTDLIIQKITSYDGIYLEDGSDSSVSDIYSIVLKNNGDTDIEYVRIALKCDDTELSFEASDIPAGASVVAQESSKTEYHAGKYTDCRADIADGINLEQSADTIKVQENKDGSLTVFNLTDSSIPCVRLFYKFYMEEEKAYIGGITYTVKLLDLEAKGSQTITPSHYFSGYSKVVMIRTYESQE